MRKRPSRKVWTLVVGLLPILLTWGIFTGPGYLPPALLLATPVFMIVFFARRPCHELVPAAGYAGSFLLVWAVGPAVLQRAQPPLIFSPNFIITGIVDELGAALAHTLVLFLYIPISFGLCLVPGLILLLVRVFRQKGRGVEHP